MIGNEWANKGHLKNAKLLVEQARGDVQYADAMTTIAQLALQVEQAHAAYMAGFEAGVLSSENGLGRFIEPEAA